MFHFLWKNSLIILNWFTETLAVQLPQPVGLGIYKIINFLVHARGPMTQISFWGLVVFIKIINSVPFLGAAVSMAILGGEFINEASFSKTITLHIVIYNEFIKNKIFFKKRKNFFSHLWIFLYNIKYFMIIISFK